jgi:hypothetical protein
VVLVGQAGAVKGTAAVWVSAIALLASLVACGETRSGDTTTPASIPALEDGTIPWVDAKARDDDFHIQAPSRRVPTAGASACRAQQLEAVLPAWAPKGDTDDGTRRSPNRGLLGMVRVTNTSADQCVLSGEVPTALLSGGAVVPIQTAHGINDEARARKTALAPGESAVLRLDWSAPYCGPRLADQVLEIQLPQKGGTLRAVVQTPSQPACTSSETHPGLRSVLYASGFDVFPVATTLGSAVDPLVVALERPTSLVTAGTSLRYVVTLTNPTGADIGLDPCPGYIEERFSPGTAADKALNEGTIYHLNCRTRAVIPAGQSLRFEMRADVPAWLSSGRALTISWRLLARALNPADHHASGFTVAIA